MKTYGVIVALNVLLSLYPAHAQQVTKVGTTAAKFLTIPVGARAIGMGGAFVAVADDPSAMFWNPSGIAQINTSEALFAHSSWIADIKFNYGAAVIPIEGFGSVGIHFTSMTMDDMEKTTETQPDGTGQFFSVGSIAVGVSYGRALTDWFSIGGSLKYVNEHISSSSATGLAIDVGTLFTTPFEGVKFGAGISNFGTKMKITGDDLLIVKDVSANAGNNANINGVLSTDKFDLPLNLRIGFSYEPIRNDDQRLILVVDAQHPNDNSESVSIGGEYSVFNNTLALRGGYKALGQRDSEERFTLGAGIKYPFGDALTFKFDYGYEKFERLATVHKFAIGVVF